MNRLFLIGFLIAGFFSTQAQIDDNPVRELAKRLTQNEMLSQRFFRDFVFIKTNNFKKKALTDMDKSLARFADNMNYIAAHLPEDNNELKEDFNKLNNFWNVYRIVITDYDNNRYKILIRKTKRFEELVHKLSMDMIETHKDYSKHKKAINTAFLDADNIKAIDKTAATYILKNNLKIPESDLFSIDFDAIEKRLKKIGKYKPVIPQTQEYIEDLYNTLETIKKTYQKEDYNPKLMFSFVSGFSKKSYKVLDIIINSI